ncbi:uncharacterized protein LOC123523764 [Mercenaria mercenaria]|uniref:uncharacterized protein LOC123523764 n=1 Tax=Mercenaria mercenaria TaxID=6596 RepID=UPI00234E423B|nr:uncharacterized protein LOC123523764 [Mercenaria mercenaria]
MADLNDPPSSSSDSEIREMFCEHCKRDDSIEDVPTAEGFCSTCTEYICKTCVKYHRTNRIGHKILDKKEMPKDLCMTNCSKHTAKLIKFYCDKCKVFACSECTTEYGIFSAHRRALHKWIHLPDFVKELELHDKSLAMIKEIEIFEKEICRMEEATLTSKASNEEYKNKATDEVRIQQTEINRMLTNFDDQMIKSIEEIVSINDKTIATSSVKINELKSEIRDIKTKIERKEALGNKCELFIDISNFLEYKNSLENKVKELSQEAKIMRFEFHPKILKCSDMGELNTFKSLRAMKLRCEIALGDSISGTNYTFSDICLMNEYSFVATVSEKRSIITLVPRKFPCLEENHLNTVIMRSAPARVTRFNQSLFVVTFPYEGKIRYFRILDTHKISDTGQDIDIGMGCLGIVFNNIAKTFVVSFKWPSSKLVTIDKAGHILQTLEKDEFGNKFFMNPWYLTLNISCDMLYVSDNQSSKVKCIKLDRKNAYCFSKTSVCTGELSIEVSPPSGISGITTDDAGHVYICSCFGITRYASDLKFIDTVDRKSSRCIAYFDKNQCICVGRMGYISIFLLE